MQARTLWLWEKCTVIPHLARWNCGGKESSNFASLEFKGVQKMIQKSGKGLESLSSLPIIWVSQECQRFLVCPYMNNHKDCWRISCASSTPVADPILVVVVVQPNMAGRKVHSPQVCGFPWAIAVFTGIFMDTGIGLILRTIPKGKSGNPLLFLLCASFFGRMLTGHYMLQRHKSWWLDHNEHIIISHFKSFW